jgi:hypothetical protein
MSNEIPERRSATDRAGRLDVFAVALLLGLAAVQASSVLPAVARATSTAIPEMAGPVPLLSAAAGLAAAALLVVLAVGRARRAPWSRPATVASLIVLIGLLVIGAGPPDVTRIALPLACLALLLVILQRRRHLVAGVTSPDFLVGALAAAAFSAALLVQRLFG